MLLPPFNADQLQCSLINRLSVMAVLYVAEVGGGGGGFEVNGTGDAER